MDFEQVYKIADETGSDSAFSKEEAGLLYDLLIKLPADANVVEIGVERGRSTSVIGEVSREIGFSHTAIDDLSVEYADENFIRERIKKYGWKTNLVISDSSVYAGVYAFNCDLLFVDGDHSYQGITKDIRAWLPKVKTGGLILFHDYNRFSLPEVLIAVKENIGIYSYVKAVGTLGVFKKNMSFEDAYKNIEHIKGLCYKEEMSELYYSAMRLPKDGVIVEIGCFMGKTSALLAQTGRRVYCIDPFMDDFDGITASHEEMVKSFNDNVLNKYKNVKLYKMSSNRAAPYFKKRKIHLLFIDGDHTYFGVVYDLRNYLPSIIDNGFLVMHDYHNKQLPWVKKAADEFTKNWHIVCDKCETRIFQKRAK